MKPPLVFLLIGCLILAGTPSPSESEVNPKTPNAKEKTALTALANPDLLCQKAGDSQATDNWQTRHEKANAKPNGDKKSGGISTLGAIAIGAGAFLVLLGIAYAGRSGSC